MRWTAIHASHAQAYYLSGDKTGCVRYIKNGFSSPATPPGTADALRL